VEIYSEQNKVDFLAAVSRYQNNVNGFWMEHRKLVYLLIIAGFVDLLSTVFFMQTVGIHREIHPMIRLFAYEYGIIWGTLLGKFAQIFMGTLAVIYYRKHAKLILVFAAVMYSWAAVANFLAYLPR
jgi:hypothetical protein